jgi:murein DD-endopeptidase MepM/ murein hydrolase activator NlpD
MKMAGTWLLGVTEQCLLWLGGQWVWTTRWKGLEKGPRAVLSAAGVLVLAGLALCLLAALPVQAARNTKKYCFRLDTAVWRISDVYGKRIDPFTGKAAFHQGLDLACAAGTAVRAVQGGVVTAAAYSPSYGNHLRILHPDGCETRYAHLQYLYVRPGEVVQAGQTLGTVGQTGRATGAHLHLELWQQGAACDPAALLENAP